MVSFRWSKKTCPQHARPYWRHLAYRTEWEGLSIHGAFSRVTLETCVLYRHLCICGFLKAFGWQTQLSQGPEILSFLPNLATWRSGREMRQEKMAVRWCSLGLVAWVGAQAFCRHHLLQKMDEFYVIFRTTSPQEVLVLWHRKDHVCFVSLQFWELPAARRSIRGCRRSRLPKVKT